jgi:predicted phage terminase large subunit-like protein
VVAVAELTEEAIDYHERLLLEQELYRRSFVDYCRTCYPDFELSAWQVTLCERLQAFAESIEEGKSPRLMVHVPPQCGKTTIVSRAFPSWMAGRRPEWDGLMASYAQSMSRKNSRWVRNRLRSTEHQRFFPRCRLSDDSQSIEDMDLTSGHQIISRGVGGGASGNPAMWVIVDDPFADRQEADSKTIRDNVDDWYTGTAVARLGPGAGILIMHTRWHMDDLCGRLLKRAKDGEDDPLVDQWEQVTFPAEWTKDQPREFYEFDEQKRGWLRCRFRMRDLMKKKANLPDRDWQSLFNQSPLSDGGNLFKRKWLNEAEAPKRFQYLYQAWDVAVTEADLDRGDWSVGVCVGKDQLGRYWLLDVCRGQWNSAELVEEMMRFAAKHKTTQRVWVEGGPIGRSIEPWLRKRIREKAALFQLEIVAHSGRGDKVARARGPLLAAMSNGSFYVPKGAAWIGPLGDELVAFPSAAHDDQVDALAILFLELQQIRESEPAAELLAADGDAARVTGGQLEDYYAELDRLNKQTPRRKK